MKNNKRILPIAIFTIILVVLAVTVIFAFNLLSKIHEFADQTAEYQDLKQSAIQTIILIFASTILVFCFTAYLWHIRQKSLLATSKQLSFITHSITGGIIVIENNPSYHIVYISDGFYQMTGYTATDIEELFHSSFIGFIHPADVDEVLKYSRLVNKDNTNAEAQYRIIKKDQSTLWVLEKTHYAVNADGKEYLYCLCTDIQNLKDQEEINYIRKESYEAAIKQISDVVLEYDFKTKQISSLGHSYLTKILNKHVFSFSDILSANLFDAPSLERMKYLCAMVEKGESLAKEEIAFWQPNSNVSSWARITFTCIHNNDNEPVCTIIILQDITSSKNLETIVLREQEYRSNILASAISAYLIDVTDAKVIEAYQEAQLKKIPHQLNYQEYVNIALETYVYADDRTKMRNWLNIDSLRSNYESGILNYEDEYRLTKRDGTIQWLRVVAQMYIDSATNHVYMLMLSRNIDKEKIKEEELTFLAQRDVLTKLYNRLAAKDEIDAYLTSTEGKNGQHAFVCLDLDGFKDINDRFGHIAGDELLCQVAKVLISVCRETDVVARLGGDEFFMFFKNINNVIDVERKISQIRKNFKAIVIASYGNIALRSCFGIALTSKNSFFDELYRKADIALYKAKSQGDNQWILYRER